jgi:glutamate racemase
MDIGRVESLRVVRAPSLAPSCDVQRDLQRLLLGPAVTPRTLLSPTILVFDSGLGGLTVLREITRARPDAAVVYAADDAVFPYGAIAEERLIARVCDVMETLIAAHAPDLVVIACNTASVQVLPALRARFAVPFVGTVPAIKPACAASVSKRVSVLGTMATVAREYTKALIREYAQGCDVNLVGSARLAGFAEAELAGTPPSDAEIAAEIAPCFVDQDGRRTDTVVLACTHFPLLLDRFRALAPWPVTWIDPAPAIARRVVDLIGPTAGTAPHTVARTIFTSGRAPAPALAKALEGFGLIAPAAAPAI